MVTIPNVHFSFRRGGGSEPEVLYGKVELKPTLAFQASTTLVLPAPTTIDLVDGEGTATNVYPTPAPVDGQIEWAYRVKVTDRHSKSFEWMVGVPDVTGTVEFASLPKYYETRPPAFGKGDRGDPGTAATVDVGTVTGGTTAQVNNSGTNTDAVLDFVLPQGPQGPKGDGTFFKDSLFSDPPSSYSAGITFGTSSTANGWPESFVLVTTEKRYAGRVVQRLVDINNNYIKQRTELGGAQANTWGPLKSVAWDTLATTTANGLMSSADKSKLEGAVWFNSPDSLVRRNAVYNFNSGTPIDPDNVANKRYVDEAIEASVPHYTPEMFGALGDGIANDTTAIRSAITAAVEINSGVVLDGTKTYKVDSNITTPAITGPSKFWLKSTGGIAELYSTSQSTAPILDIRGSAFGNPLTVTNNVTYGDTVCTLSSVEGLYPGALLTMDSAQSWYYDPRTESSDARRSELHVIESIESGNRVILEGTFAESYSASLDTLTVQAYHPLETTIEGLKIVRELPPVAEESSRHGLLRVSYAVKSSLSDIHLDGGTEYGLSLTNCYKIRAIGGSATRCNNYWTGYGISVAGSHHVEVAGYHISRTRRGIDITQGGKTISRYVDVHDNHVIGGGKNSRGGWYGYTDIGWTGVQQSGMGSHGGADLTNYYRNTIIRVPDPISLRGGNENVENNTIIGQSVNGAITAGGGGIIRVINNTSLTGVTGGKDSEIFSGPALGLKRPEEFVKIHETFTPGGEVHVIGNTADVQFEFISFADASLGLPHRLVVKDNTVYHGSNSTVGTTPLVLLANLGPTLVAPSGGYRWVVALNWQHIVLGSGALTLTSKLNIYGAQVLNYTTSGATT